MNTPGLVMVAPSNVRDAAGLLRSAIRSQDPVLYWEHKKLYRSMKEDLPAGEEIMTPIGEAAVTREGRDVTAISFGYMHQVCTEAAERLAGDGMSVLEWLSALVKLLLLVIGLLPSLPFPPSPPLSDVFAQPIGPVISLEVTAP